MPTRVKRDRWGCGGAQGQSRATRVRGKSWRRGISGRATAGNCCPVPARGRTSGPDAREVKTPEALSRWKGKYWRPSTSSLQRPLWLTRSSCWWWVSPSLSYLSLFLSLIHTENVRAATDSAPRLVSRFLDVGGHVCFDFALNAVSSQLSHGTRRDCTLRLREVSG